MANRTRDRLINIRVNDAEYEALNRLAKKRGQSVSDLIRTMVKEERGGAGYWEKSQALVDKSEALLAQVLDERAANEQQKEEALTALNKSLAMLSHIEAILLAQAYAKEEPDEEREQENTR